MAQAMKARDEARLGALRMIKTALKKHEVDSMKPLDEAAEMQVLKSLVKQRQEAAEMFRKGGRPELADKEEAELRADRVLPARGAQPRRRWKRPSPPRWPRPASPRSSRWAW